MTEPKGEVDMGETQTREVFEWGIVEIFGHRRHAGKGVEEERFGTKMLRIDIPVKGDPEANGWETRYYGGASIFSFTLTDEPTALRMNKPYEPPRRYIAPPQTDDATDFGDDVEDLNDTELS